MNIKITERNVKDEIIKGRHKLVVFEGPEGLLDKLKDLAGEIEKEKDVAVVVIGDPCRGSCDLKASHIPQADLVFHFGHVPTVSTHHKNLRFVDAWVEVKNPLKKMLTKENLEIIGSMGKIGLATTNTYEKICVTVKKFLEKEGFNVLGEIAEITGCNFDKAMEIEEKIDSFLFVGDGRFHPIGLSLVTEKPVYKLGLEEKNIKNLEETKEKIVRKRLAIIEKARESKKIGILIGLKTGQKNISSALKVRDLLSKKYETTLIAMDEITPAKTLNFKGIDSYVVTACPRVPLDDVENYVKPMLTLKEGIYLARGGRLQIL